MVQDVVPNTRAVTEDENRTVKVYKDGTARLSSALIREGGIHTKAVDIQVDTKKKHAYIKVGASFKMWYSNETAKSPLVAFRSTLTTLGLDPYKAAGTYSAKAQAGVITIDLSKKV